MSNVTRSSLIFLAIFSCIHNYCLYFQTSSSNLSNFCQSRASERTIETSYKECLLCEISFLSINSINQIDNCTHIFECVEFIFYNETLFEQFFQRYAYLIPNLFKPSGHSRIEKSLHIQIKHDNYQKLNFTYLQSVLHSNGIDYSFLTFSLRGNRKQIHLDLQTNFWNLSLHAVRIEIFCNETTKYFYDVTPSTNYSSQSHVCFDAEYKLPTATQTPEKDSKVRLNLILFFTGLIVLLIWILCICTCLYARYCKWKTNDMVYQRSSIVSSVFSLDSTVSDRTENISSTKQVKQVGRYGLYAYNNEL
ncbi:unnamed protein product [Adineta ricciae]|uniref:Transmembrane protein n=1 Tax=Adineta ricciae TaxID=249248 RepID=A0A815NXY1_ADIRI|nr:unnamed protein product [Adineta ricciae]